MNRWVSTVGLCLLATSLPVFAQQANQNINVLPVPNSVDPQDPLAAALTGDLYLQRQVEPTIAVSTRNPDHLIAFFNDYRAVDIPDDAGLGETQNIAAKKGVLDRFLAWFRGRPEPVAAAAPCGRVEVVWLAFTRGGRSEQGPVRVQLAFTVLDQQRVILGEILSDGSFFGFENRVAAWAPALGRRDVVTATGTDHGGVGTLPHPLGGKAGTEIGHDEPRKAGAQAPRDRFPGQPSSAEGP